VTLHSSGRSAGSRIRRSETVNCRVCQRIFEYRGYGPKVCPNCMKREDDLFEKVRTYLETHPRATLVQTHMDTGVSLRKLQAWIREDRLGYSSVAGGLSCKLCGTPIVSGTLCPKCSSRMGGGTPRKGSYSGQATEDDNKMRFIKH
jgi:rubrerythrin